MSRKKGSKNKPKISGTVEDPNIENLPPDSDDSLSFDMSDREAIYEKSNAIRSGEETSESDVTSEQIARVMEEEGLQDDQPVKEVEQEAKPEEIKQQKAEPEKEATEHKLEEKIEEEAKEEKPEEFIKKVPLAALHEERDKRKEYGRQVDQLISDNRELMQFKREREEGDETQYVDEETTRVKKLEQRLSHFEERQELADQESRKTKLNSVIGDIDKTLAEKGFPGFKSFGKSQVGDILDAMNPEDAKHFDSPDGWMQIYTEQVYPEVSKVFEERFKSEHFSKKDALKNKARLVSSTGKVKSAEEKEEKLTPYEKYKRDKEEYLMERDKTSLS